MDPFLDQLKTLCRQFPTRAKWVFVPTHALGRTIGDRLARDGTDWANLRFATPLNVALRMGAPFLLERGIDPSEEDLGPALMMRLLLERPEGGYFRPLARHPTLAQALWTTIRELRMAGLHSDALPANAFVSPAKHAELAALFSAYERFLDEHRRADMAGVFHEALRHTDWSPVRSQDCRTKLPDHVWSPLEQQLLDALPGERLAPAALDLPAVSTPRRLAASRLDRQKPDAATNRLAFLMAPGSAAAPDAAAPAIDLFHAGGREAEMEEVFRRILSRGVPLDQVEIACASDVHAALVWEKALRHGWPVTVGSGLPAAFTRPGRALLGFCDWIDADFPAGQLRRLLQSGDLHVGDEEGFTAGEAARVLARAEVGWGRDGYDIALGRLQRSDEARAADPDAPEADRADRQERAELTARVRRWLTKLVASVPAPATGGRVQLQTVVQIVLDVLEQATARGNALDHHAATALQEWIGGLRALGGFACPLPEALRFIRERVESLVVARDRARPGHLHACSLSQCGYAGRPHVFVAGLEEGRVFPASSEDAVLLDAERTAISTDLRQSADRVDEAVYTVLSRLAPIGGSVTFSYSCRDTREFRETYASWLLLQASRVQQGQEALSYDEMKAALGEPKSAVPSRRDDALSARGWWLRSVAGTGAAGIATVDAAFPGVAQGRAAAVRRESPEFTMFDGLAATAGPFLDPCASGAVYSVTDLENAAECPFRFFLKRGLRIRPIDDREPDQDTWLDALTRGRLLHDVYAALLRRTRDAPRRPEMADLVWLKEIAQHELDAVQAEMPAPTEEILARETAAFLEDVEIFLDAEVGETTANPIGLEVSFGRPLKDDEDPLARSEPVAIDLGEGQTIRIAGRIDRIDRVSDSSFEVIDYKTGGYWADNWKGVFAGGTRLQHALYGLAAQELLKSRDSKPRVTGGVYYFSSRKGGREKVRIPAPSRASIAVVLSDLREVIRAGQFIRTPDQNNCRFCEYAAACGGAVNGQAKGKMNDPRFPAFGKLVTHE